MDRTTYPLNMIQIQIYRSAGAEECLWTLATNISLRWSECMRIPSRKAELIPFL